MGKYILKRCVYIVLVFLILSFLMYALYNLIPSDPARQELEPQRKGLKVEEYQMLYQQLRKEMGLDDPLMVRYLRWLGLWRDTDGRVDIFIAGVGTGGTVTGVGEYLKEQNPDIKVVALEPEDSPVLSEGRAGAHKIQGIGAGFVPDVLNTGVYDEVFKAPNQKAFETAKLLAKKEGISVGISSGAALFGAIELAKRPENKGKVIVALLPDSGDRYYSTALFTG